MGQQMRVLYVDDDEGRGERIRSWLMDHDYQISWGRDGGRGVTLYQTAVRDERLYDMVVMAATPDIWPFFSFLEEQGPIPPTILLTSCGQERLALQGMRLGGRYTINCDEGGVYLDLLLMYLEQQRQQTQLIWERQEALRAVQRRNRELRLLNQIGQELTTILDLNLVTHRLLQRVSAVLGTDSCSVWLIDAHEEDVLICWAAFQQPDQPSLVGWRLEPGQGIAGWVVQRGESVLVSSADDDKRFFDGVDMFVGSQTTSLLTVPLKVRDTTIGVLEVINKKDGEFTEHDQVLVETLAASAAIAIDNARMVGNLHQYTSDLQAQNAELDAFAHTVAHDLKNPLTALVGSAGLLTQHEARMTPALRAEQLEKILRNGQKMENIIKELLLLANVRKGEVQTAPLRMGRIVAEAVNRLEHMIKAYEPEIVMPEEWPTARGYGPWVEEIWANYLSNALKYGGRPPRIELGANKTDDGMIRFWVRDNGGGISLEDQVKLFVPFNRFSQATKIEGQGLGLSIVRRIVEKIDGKVGVESLLGKGSEFWFTLPAG
ncbi:MAG TPA: ATP-binding protein [Anaerolineae bacterium]|nr:ATP-binding protein [Anaerolineae bacterium]